MNQQSLYVLVINSRRRFSPAFATLLHQEGDLVNEISLIDSRILIIPNRRRHFGWSSGSRSGEGWGSDYRDVVRAATCRGSENAAKTGGLLRVTSSTLKTLEDNPSVPTNRGPSNNHLPICLLWLLQTLLKPLQQVCYPADD